MNFLHEASMEVLELLDSFRVLDGRMRDERREKATAHGAVASKEP
jgi:hypothetical protein